LEVASVRLTEEEKRFIDRLITQGKFSSVSEALKAGLYELMREERLKQLPWQTRGDVRKYFAKRRRSVKGLEELHDEED
jgi:putative addiction module CopG family antidote